MFHKLFSCRPVYDVQKTVEVAQVLGGDVPGSQSLRCLIRTVQYGRETKADTSP